MQKDKNVLVFENCKFRWFFVIYAALPGYLLDSVSKYRLRNNALVAEANIDVKMQ